LGTWVGKDKTKRDLPFLFPPVRSPDRGHDGDDILFPYEDDILFPYEDVLQPGHLDVRIYMKPKIYRD